MKILKQVCNLEKSSLPSVTVQLLNQSLAILKSAILMQLEHPHVDTPHIPRHFYLVQIFLQSQQLAILTPVVRQYRHPVFYLIQV